jgi:hypothetical protein
MSNDLALLEEKIRQLPAHLVLETNDFVNFLLQKHQAVDIPKETGFWAALQQFRQQTDLNEFSEDVFVDVRE